MTFYVASYIWWCLQTSYVFTLLYKIANIQYMRPWVRVIKNEMLVKAKNEKKNIIMLIGI